MHYLYKDARCPIFWQALESDQCWHESGVSDPWYERMHHMSSTLIPEMSFQGTFRTDSLRELTGRTNWLRRQVVPTKMSRHKFSKKKNAGYICLLLGMYRTYQQFQQNKTWRLGSLVFWDSSLAILSWWTIVLWHVPKNHCSTKTNKAFSTHAAPQIWSFNPGISKVGDRPSSTPGRLNPRRKSSWSERCCILRRRKPWRPLLRSHGSEFRGKVIYAR